MPLDPHRTSVPKTHPPGYGWKYWITEPPPHHARMVEAWHHSWQTIEVINLDTLHPRPHVVLWPHGVLWRPLSKPRLEPEVAAHAP